MFAKSLNVGNKSTNSVGEFILYPLLILGS